MDFEINKLKVVDTLLLDESSREVLELYNIRDIFNNSRDVSGKYYKDEYSNYKKVLEILSSFIKEHNMNVLEAIGFLSYIVHSGRLSFDKCTFEFDESIEIESELIGYSGAQVLTGSGCCRHLSNFFVDVLTLCDFDSKYILNDVCDISGFPFTFCDQIFNYHLDLKEVHEEDNGFVKGKHACILFPYKNSYLVYDPTNLTILYVDDLKAFSIGGIDTMKINLSPSSLVLYGDFSYPEMIEFIQGVRDSKFDYVLENEIIDFISKGIRVGKKTDSEFEKSINVVVDKYREFRLARLDGSIHLKYIND